MYLLPLENIGNWDMTGQDYNFFLLNKLCCELILIQKRFYLNKITDVHILQLKVDDIVSWLFQQTDFTFCFFQLWQMATAQPPIAVILLNWLKLTLFSTQRFFFLLLQLLGGPCTSLPLFFDSIAWSLAV